MEVDTQRDEPHSNEGNSEEGKYPSIYIDGVSSLALELRTISDGPCVFRNSSEPPEKESSLNIEYLNLSMKDQVECDITFYIYDVIEFIESAL